MNATLPEEGVGLSLARVTAMVVPRTSPESAPEVGDVVVNTNGRRSTTDGRDWRM